MVKTLYIKTLNKRPRFLYGHYAYILNLFVDEDFSWVRMCAKIFLLSKRAYKVFLQSIRGYKGFFTVRTCAKIL